ncbi:hypothetical protein D8B34_16900 [Verminephrobacter eiseniae]|nr:hypothetical protein [Verminephrobacter eiseniae]MCW5296452.1 hypothetical protein [Verminephrobacter eiseniae]MCW8187047.1 hypothetical protein [Verminephrobacter eiseniae]MCW8224302.1 hypothetical protein [Verminephrobacter eiseniae]MCW8235380.1 hypothetical protein [Verminephrobacter eiseniae]
MRQRCRMAMKGAARWRAGAMAQWDAVRAGCKRPYAGRCARADLSFATAPCCHPFAGLLRYVLVSSIKGRFR